MARKVSSAGRGRGMAQTSRNPSSRVARRPAAVAPVPALEALARIARAELAAVRANAARVRRGEGGESLHDLRVAVRRLRSWIAQLEGVLRAKERAHLTAELRWLTGCTGRARDLDTLLDELRASEPRLGAQLVSVATVLEEERGRARAQVVAALDSARARRLLARLRATFAGKGDPDRAGPKAAKPFARLLAKRLRRRSRRVVALVERLDARSPAGELHALRIAGKKLRYLLECCRGFAPEAALKPCLRRLKRLQAELGKVQDVEVQRRLLKALAPRLELLTEAGPRPAPALARFRARLKQASRSARARQAEFAAELVAPEARAEFETLLRALERPRPGRR